VKPLLASIALLASTGTFAADPPGTPDTGTFLLTIFLKHDQSKNLGEIQAELKKAGFKDKFSPKGIEVVSWYVMMGIGQVVTEFYAT